MTTHPYRQRTVAAAFSAVATRLPDRVAVTAGDGRLSYRELDDRADRLAAGLIAAGVRADEPVGVLVRRSAAEVVGVLGVLKAGAAYLALDPADPPERRARLCAGAGVRVVLATDDLAGGAPAGLSALTVSASGPLTATPPSVTVPSAGDTPGADTLAYVAYTSGSTGLPKAVGVPHRGVLALALGSRYAEIVPEDVVLRLAPLSFDASTFELWATLLHGGTLAVYPVRPFGAAELAATVAELGVTVLFLTAALFHQVVDAAAEQLSGVRVLVAGGDVLSARRVDRLLEAVPGIRVVNGYGPTENTTFTCVHVVRTPGSGPMVPIGRPVQGTDVRILDPDLNPLPPGSAGELYAGGESLARGYLGDPRRTADQFRPDPFGDRPGRRMYATGDRVRQRADGALDFLGRSDRQVKIRGYRVEPAEVETVLRGLPEVLDAVVTVHRPSGTGDPLLAAFVRRIKSAETDDLVGLRRALHALLPPYLVPTYLVPVAELPVTATGKTDADALEIGARLAREAVTDRPYAEPHTRAQQVVAELVGDLLDLDRVGADDDFFELGGNSLLAMTLAMDVRAALAVDLPVRAVFEHPTVDALAARLERAGDRK